MDRNERGYWSAEKLAPMVAWKKENGKDWKETAQHFGEDHRNLAAAFYKLRKAGVFKKNGQPRKAAAAKVSKVGTKRNLPAKVETFEFAPIQREVQGQKKVAVFLVNYDVNEIFGAKIW